LATKEANRIATSEINKLKKEDPNASDEKLNKKYRQIFNSVHRNFSITHQSDYDKAESEGYDNSENEDYDYENEYEYENENEDEDRDK
jgi:hypothetical protein